MLGGQEALHTNNNKQFKKLLSKIDAVDAMQRHPIWLVDCCNRCTFMFAPQKPKFFTASYLYTQTTLEQNSDLKKYRLNIASFANNGII